MRIALLSDIHGNRIALDAALEDARSLGVEQFWFVGDFCAIGPEPVAVLDRVAELSGSLHARGNTDRYVVTGDGPPPDLSTVRRNPELISTFAEIAASSAWTKGYLTAVGWLPWLEALPLEIRTTSPAGIRILAVHASPGTDDGEGVHPGRSNAELSDLLEGCSADLVFVGHTHEPMVRRIDGVVLVNLGSIGNPTSPDLRASYVVMDSTSSGIELQHRRVAYDHEAFTASVVRSRHPSSGFILAHQRGEHAGRPHHPDHVPLTSGMSVRLDARVPI